MTSLSLHANHPRAIEHRPHLVLKPIAQRLVEGLSIIVHGGERLDLSRSVPCEMGNGGQDSRGTHFEVPEDGSRVHVQLTAGPGQGQSSEEGKAEL